MEKKVISVVVIHDKGCDCMKIVFVDISVGGHHLVYLNGIIENTDIEPVLIVSEKIEGLECKQYVAKAKDRTIKRYIQWIKEVHKIVDKEKPDIVHFLYGDAFYRYFGYGLKLFKKYRTVVTLHWARTKFIEKISTKILATMVDTVVVHSLYIKNLIENYGIKNIVDIEYPQFNSVAVDKKKACEFFGLAENVPVIACIGNTRYDKGLDLLLEALKDVNRPFQLLVAGKEDAFDEKYIREHTDNYKEKVKFYLRYLSDEEIACAFSAADIIALPYRKNFNGASGPLTEGVSLNKCILGPEHGDLGFKIRTYHLGYTFETENISNLAFVIDEILTKGFKVDDVYASYRKALEPDLFKQKYNKLYDTLTGEQNV